MLQIKVYGMEDLDTAVEFHGHLCPMFYMGFRMGHLALKKLGRPRERGVKLHAVVEFPNCFADGVQFVTGATFGKNNLHLDDRGKFAASFYDLSSGKDLRLKMKKEVVSKVLEYGKAGLVVKELPPDKREEETRVLMVSGREMVGWLKGLGDDDMFETLPAPSFLPEDGPSLDYIVCSDCGELTLKEYSKKRSEKNFCTHCTG
jgi:formylmethanofuran dehydrogenase subunit E